MAAKDLSDKEIFNFARQLESPEAVSEYLDQVCVDDTGRKQRIQLLLDADSEDSFLENGAFPMPETVESRKTDSAAGMHIGNYKLIHLLGEGGMGSVFLAEQITPVKRRVAIKIIKLGMNTNQFIARFEAERQALAMMDHPNIAKVLDAGCTDDGRPYFVMELVKGVPITTYCDDNCLTNRERLQLFVPVCQAVQHAHQKGIIHRDLKPSNVMVAMYDDRPVPKVIDFGVAKATHQPLTEQTLCTVPGQIVGTWDYMSPEQAILNQLDVDTRTDVYSLGVILYELLTGETPLDLKSLQSGALEERLRRIREEEPSRPSIKISGLGEAAKPLAVYRQTEVSLLARSIRGDLDWIVMKALEKDRSRRYETANGMAAEVARYLNDEPLSFRPPSKWKQFRRVCRRNKAVATTTIITILALCIGLVIANWQYRVAIENATRAAESAEALEKKIEELDLQRSVAEDRLGVVKDYTMLLARSGEPRDLELAIKTSQVVGASDVWQIMLRAQSAIERGEPSRAVELLHQGTKCENDPELLACIGMLAQALILAGFTDDYVPLYQELQNCSPASPEEFIFVGQGLILDSKTWWRMANEAVNLRDSPFARLNRAAASHLFAVDSGRLEIAVRGIEDLVALEKHAMETPYLISLRLLLHLTAMNLADESGGSVETWRGQAENDVKKLEFRRDYGWGLLAVAWYKDRFAGDEADAAWESVLKYGAGGWHDIHAAAMILRQGSLDRWRDELNGDETLERIALAALLANGSTTDHTEAMKIYEDIASKREIVSMRTGSGFEIPLIAKKITRVQSDAEMLLETNAKFLTPFAKTMVQFLADQLKLGEFEERISQFDRVDQLQGHFMAGLVARANGDEVTAKQQFQKSIDTCVYHTSDYYWAKAYLNLMKTGTEKIKPNTGRR